VCGSQMKALNLCIRSPCRPNAWQLDKHVNLHNLTGVCGEQQRLRAAVFIFGYMHSQQISPQNIKEIVLIQPHLIAA